MNWRQSRVLSVTCPCTQSPVQHFSAPLRMSVKTSDAELVCRVVIMMTFTPEYVQVPRTLTCLSCFQTVSPESALSDRLSSTRLPSFSLRLFRPHFFARLPVHLTNPLQHSPLHKALHCPPYSSGRCSHSHASSTHCCPTQSPVGSEILQTTSRSPSLLTSLLSCPSLSFSPPSLPLTSPLLPTFISLTSYNKSSACTQPLPIFSDPLFVISPLSFSSPFLLSLHSPSLSLPILLIYPQPSLCLLPISSGMNILLSTQWGPAYCLWITSLAAKQSLFS